MKGDHRRGFPAAAVGLNLPAERVGRFIFSVAAAPNSILDDAPLEYFSQLHRLTGREPYPVRSFEIEAARPVLREINLAGNPRKFKW